MLLSPGTLIGFRYFKKSKLIVCSYFGTGEWSIDWHPRTALLKGISIVSFGENPEPEQRPTCLHVQFFALYLSWYPPFYRCQLCCAQIKLNIKPSLGTGREILTGEGFSRSLLYPTSPGNPVAQLSKVCYLLSLKYGFQKWPEIITQRTGAK